jgi:hypothetical protein
MAGLQRKTLLIRSQDRVNGSDTQFTVRFPTSITNVVAVNLLQVVIQDGVFNVESNSNTFWLRSYDASDNPVDSAVVLSTGYYDSTAFEIVLGAALTAASTDSTLASVWSVAIEVDTGKLSIINATTEKWAIMFTSGLSTQPGTAAMMGFSPVSGIFSPPLYQVSPPYNVVSTRSMHLPNFDYLLVLSQVLGVGDNVETPNGIAAWAFIPNTTRVFGSSTISWENTRQPFLDLASQTSRDITTVDIAITDAQGSVVDTRGNHTAFLVELYSRVTD